MNKEAEDDPFDAFGDDDDNDDDDDEEQANINNKEAMAVARSLVKAANERVKLPHENLRTITTTQAIILENNDDDRRHSQLEDLAFSGALDLNWTDPVYKGKIVLVSSLPLGGGRGYVASEIIPPGTLVLVESPMMEWPEDQLGKKTWTRIDQTLIG